MKSLKDAIKNRRSYYSIDNSSPVSDQTLHEIVNFAVENVPSAFNSQTTRVVLFLGEAHKKLWSITLDKLRPLVPVEAFPTTEAKIASFAAGHGTILFFEDQDVIRSLQTSFSLYAANFPVWSQHTSAMHQYAVWMLLEEVGLGASLQHYNEVIEDTVKAHWGFPSQWKMIAQMPFGTSTAAVGEKSFLPLNDRVKVLTK